MTTLTTARLTLRPFVNTDLDALHKILFDPTTMRFWPAPFTQEQSSAWLERNISRFSEDGCGRMALLLSASGTLIGDCGIVRAEINGTLESDLGYIVHTAHHGHGYATEAAMALKVYGFQTLRRIAEKIGMTLEREFDNPRNRGIRTCLYSMEHLQD